MIVINFIIAMLFNFVLVTYYIFIKQGSFDKWWFKMLDTFPLWLFSITSTLATIGFLYIIWYMVWGLDRKDDKLTLEFAIILASTLLWAPLTHLAMTKSKLFKYLVVLVLGITSGSSIAFIYFLATRHSHDNIAIGAMFLFAFHVTIVDFFIWNYHFLKNLEK